MNEMNDGLYQINNYEDINNFCNFVIELKGA